MATYEEIKIHIENSDASPAKQKIMLMRLMGISSPGMELKDSDFDTIFEGMLDLLEKVKPKQSF